MFYLHQNVLHVLHITDEGLFKENFSELSHESNADLSILLRLEISMLWLRRG